MIHSPPEHAEMGDKRLGRTGANNNRFPSPASSIPSPRCSVRRLLRQGPIPLAELHQLKATQDRGSKVVATNLAVFRQSPLAPQWPAPHGLLTIDVSKG